jgi:hypothetical protein
MPKSGFGSDYKQKDPFDYPRLKLSVGDRARICVIGEPDYEYLHTIEAVITEDGRPKMVKSTVSGGREIERPATDFRGQFVCLGDLDTLAKKGIDPDNCPACKAHVENGQAVKRPERRYIVHILKYTTKKGSFTATQPFSAEVMAWTFNDKRHASLSDIADEHGDISRIDLLLGPSEPPEKFQRYPIMPGGQAEWTKSEENKKIAMETLKNNKSDDLPRLLGRKVDATSLRSAVQEVVNIYNQAFGFPGQIPTQEAEKEIPQASSDLDSEIKNLLDEETSNEEPNTEESASTEEKEAKPVKEEGKNVSLLDLVDSL